MKILNNFSMSNWRKRNKRVSRSIEKLSSGLRINKAADDAAGLAISERMESKRRGICQAQRNIQDGISMLQTSEAGLGKIQEYLQRMRALIIKAANDTLSLGDRAKIEEEIDELRSGINDIANHTMFNETRVLCPPILDTGIQKKADIVFVVDNTGSMATIQEEVKNNLLDMIQNISDTGITDIRMGLVEYKDFIINKFSFSSGKWTSNPNEIINGLDIMIGSNSGGTENAMQAISEAVDYYDFRDNEVGTHQKHIVLVTNEDADDQNQLSSTISELQVEDIQLYGVYKFDFVDGVEELDALVNDTGGKAVDISKPLWGKDLATNFGSAIGEAGSKGELEMPDISLQIGSDESDNLLIKLMDARSSKLGIDLISLTSSEQAMEALKKINMAMDMVSSYRSENGSYRNRLEYIQNNLANYELNITSAKSMITDSDMVKEIMELTKNQIISEASEAITVQAKNILRDFMENLLASIE
ncbi:MAG: flagellin [Halanaerobiales bacterium]|nr:flagellin [Halanaerobiales bacterium]